MSSAMLPFDRVHMPSYSTLVETVCLSCTVFEIQGVIYGKLCICLHFAHLHLAPLLGVIPFE